MAFNTLSRLKEIYLSVRSKVKDAPPATDEVLSVARSFAFGAILSALMERGFTAAQVNAWDRGAEFEADLVLWWIFRSVPGANQGSYPAEIQPKHWDRREELKTVFVTTNSEAVATTNTTAISFGLMDDSQDRVRMDTRWS